MAKYDKKRIIELREQGKTYKNIADEVGCSKQYVALVCGKTNPNKFRYIQNDQCVYPNLRKWMNENKISRKALIRLSKCYESTGSSVHLSHFLQGVTEPTKQVIDRLIETTGIPYEVLFSKVECQSSVAVVVRCKDCKYYKTPDGFKPRCSKDNGLYGYPSKEDFCSYGERRTDDNN